MNQATDLSTGIAATGITLAGVVTGLSYDVLLAGFAGGLVSLSFLGPMKIWSRMFSVLTSTLMAGYSAPVLLALMLKHWPGLMPDNLAATLLFVAFWTGVLGQFLTPVIIGVARRRIKSYGPAQEE